MKTKLKMEKRDDDFQGDTTTMNIVHSHTKRNSKMSNNFISHLNCNYHVIFVMLMI